MKDLSLLWRLKRGFTLIEILIAVTLLLVITVAAFSTFRGGTAAWERGTAHAQRRAEVRVALEMMTRELSEAILVRSDGIYQIDFLLDAHRIYFVGSVEEPRRGQPGQPVQPDIMKVRYSLEGGEIRRATDRIDTDITHFPGDSHILASDIESLTFEFLDEAGVWRLDWDSRTAEEGGVISVTRDTLPDAVRIILISDPDPPSPDEGLAPKTFSAIIELARRWN